MTHRTRDNAEGNGCTAPISLEKLYLRTVCTLYSGRITLWELTTPMSAPMPCALKD